MLPLTRVKINRTCLASLPLSCNASIFEQLALNVLIRDGIHGMPRLSWLARQGRNTMAPCSIRYFICIISTVNCRISIQICMFPVVQWWRSTLAQVMAWCRADGKPLLKKWWPRLLAHASCVSICIWREIYTVSEDIRWMGKNKVTVKLLI